MIRKENNITPNIYFSVLGANIINYLYSKLFIEVYLFTKINKSILKNQKIIRIFSSII